MSTDNSGNNAASPVTATVTLTPEQIQAALAPLIKDAQDSVNEVKKVIADVKANGINGALADSGDIAKEAEQIYGDVKTALPVIKSGFKTTEFWLVLAALLVISVFAYIGKPLSLDASALITLLVSIYTAARSLVKAPAATAPATAAK